MALTDNLVAYYKFDDSTSTDVVGANDGTDTGMVYGSSYGKIGNGAKFTSNTNYSKVTSNVWSLFSGTNAWSIQVWANIPVATAASQHIFGANVSDSSTYINYGLNMTINFDGTNGTVSAYHGNGTNTETIFDTTGGNLMSAATWYHIVATFDGGTTYKCYINAVSANTVSGRLYTSGTMGSGYLGVAKYNVAFEGGTGDRYMDEYAFWSRAISSTEVTQLYNSGNGFQYPFIPFEMKKSPLLTRQAVSRAAYW